MVTVVQLVRASDCGSECRGFESHQSPSSNPLQLCVVRDFFVYLPSPPLSLLSVRALDRSATRLLPLPTPGMLPPSCLALVVATVRPERFAPIRQVPLADMSAHTRTPMPVAAENDLPRFIVACEAGQIVCSSGEVMPRCRCVSRKDCRVLSKRPFPRARGRGGASGVFRFLPSPFTYLCKVQ